MSNAKIAVLVTCSILALILVTALAKNVRASSLNMTNDLFYLCDSKIFKIVDEVKGKAELVYSPPKEQKGEKYQINGLSCGSDNELLFHMTHTTGLVPDYSNAKEKTVIVAYNLVSREVRSLIDIEGVSLTFPSLSPDKAKVAASAGDGKHNASYFIVKNLQTGTIQTYDSFDAAVKKVSWSSDSRFLAITGKDKQTGKVMIYLLDLEKNIVKPLLEGIMPVISPSGQRIAYISADQDQLLVTDINGRIQEAFKGELFNDVNEWIGDDKIIFTMAHSMYQDHIGIADLRTKKIKDISIPTKGEIRGICYKDKGR